MYLRLAIEFKCENMTAFGCKARDFAKQLLLIEQIENDVELDPKKICKKQCCRDCDANCSVRCKKMD